MDFSRRPAADLESRLRLLEDIEEIRWMKAYYAQVCDDKFTAGHRPKPQDEIDAMVRPMVERIFADDAVWDGSSADPAIQGREAIFERLRASTWTFAMHYYMNPRIEVEGDAAHARWMLWEPCTAAKTNQALWMSAVTEDDYVRTPDGWRIRKYVVRYKFLTPFDQPWPGRPLASI